MGGKTNLYNLALNALLIQYKIANAESDRSVQKSILDNFFLDALKITLQELDLDSTASIKRLELIEEDPITAWLYAYKYPTDAVFIRRIYSGNVSDNESNRIKFRTAYFNNEKVIFTNQHQAEVEYISKDVDIDSLPSNAKLAIAHMLAFLATPLQVNSKNAVALRKQILENYDRFKGNAKKVDEEENFQFDQESEISSFVRARTT